MMNMCRNTKQNKRLLLSKQMNQCNKWIHEQTSEGTNKIINEWEIRNKYIIEEITKQIERKLELLVLRVNDR